MSVTTSNFHFPSNGWCNRATSMMIMTATASSESVNPGSSPNVDDGLTSLSWLQNLNMCMTRLGAPTPPTPPASPICSGNSSNNNGNNVNINNIKLNTNHNANHKNNSNTKCTLLSSSTVEGVHNTNIHKIHSLYQNHRDHRSNQNGHINGSRKLSQSNENEIVDYKTNGNVKPPYSYATLICMAMKANKNKMTLSSIYKWIRENFMYYKNADPSWQNSIRHNLSLNKCFIKIPRNKDEPGKGGFWRLDPIYADTLVDGVFKKRRPSQRGSNSSNTNNTSAPFRKKSRRKEPLRNKSLLSSSVNGGKNMVSNGTEATILHDTPPNSAESYNLYGEAQNDVVELVTAVNSIESVGHCPSYSYTMHNNHSECEPHLSHHGYADEVCITESASDTCMLETDGNEICWNAILTDADLNELVDPVSYTGPVLHTTEPSLTVSDSTRTTAQLTAVEPHSLHLVTSASPITHVLEDSELFHNGVTPHINCLAINHRSNVGSDVISATHNVVTCVNPTNVSTNEWNSWPTFSAVTAHDSQNSAADLLIRQISGNCESIVSEIVSPSPPIAYITTTSTTITARPSSGPKLSNCVNNQQNINSNSGSSTQPSSPTSANFENTNSLQPWAECKAALEAAALDLESFGNLDAVHNY